MRFPLIGYLAGILLCMLIFIFIFVHIYYNSHPSTDGYFVNTPAIRAIVKEVAADPIVPGKVYAQVECGICRNGGLSVYESTDYGQHWHITEHPFIRVAIGVPRAVTVGGDTLWYKNARLWTLPKRMFRAFFSNFKEGKENSSPYNPPYIWKLPIPYFVVPEGQDVIYAPMGAYGVLVGSNPPESWVHPWQVSHDGIEGIVSPLTLHEPLTIFFVIIFALLVPPLPILHTWLLGQAYRYAYPIAEPDDAFKLGFKVSGILTIFAAGAVYIWLTNEIVDYYLIVNGMTALTILLSVGAAIGISIKRGFSNWFTLRLAIATALLAGIVPFGVASTMQGYVWPIIFTVIISFIAYREAINDYLDRQSARITLWQTDRLSIELLVIFLIMLVPLGALAYTISQKIRWGSVGIVMLILTPIISIVGLAVYASVRGNAVVVKKTGSLKSDYHDSPLFANRFWWSTMLRYTAYAAVGGLIVSGMVYITQILAYLWFYNLAR